MEQPYTELKRVITLLAQGRLCVQPPKECSVCKGGLLRIGTWVSASVVTHNCVDNDAANPVEDLAYIVSKQNDIQIMLEGNSTEVNVVVI